LALDKLSYGSYIQNMANRIIHVELAKLIRQARGARTQEELAAKYKVTRQLVFLWEHGLSKPSPAIMKDLGIAVTYELKVKKNG